MIPLIEDKLDTLIRLSQLSTACVIFLTVSWLGLSVIYLMKRDHQHE